VDDGCDELNFLGHALGELLYFGVRVGAQAEAIQPRPRPLSRLLAGQPLDGTQEDQDVHDARFLIQPALFRQVADALLRHAPRLGDAVQMERDAARVRGGDAHDHAQGRRLTGAVGPEKPENLPSPDGKRNRIYGGLPVIAFYDAVNVENGVRQFTLSLLASAELGAGG